MRKPRGLDTDIIWEEISLFTDGERSLQDDVKKEPPVLGANLQTSAILEELDIGWESIDQHGRYTRLPASEFEYQSSLVRSRVPRSYISSTDIAEEEKKKVTSLYFLYAAIAVFAILYMAIDSNMDAFNFEEFGESIIGEDIVALWVRKLGLAMAFLGNLAMLPVIIYCWLEKDDHDESWGQMLWEYLGIGAPFFVLGVAAFYDTLSKFPSISRSSWWCPPVAILSGLIELVAAIKLHGYMADKVAHSHLSEHNKDDFWTGMLAGYYDTFLVLKRPGWKGVGDMAVKWGILIGHALVGFYAAISFITQMALAGHALPVWAAYILIGALTALITLTEGLTESYSYDQLDIDFGKYSYGFLAVVVFCGLFHILPSVTAGTWLLTGGTPSISAASTGAVLQSGGAGLVYNMVCMSFMTLTIGLTNLMGFVAMTAKPLDKAASRCQASLFGKTANKIDSHDTNDHNHPHGHGHTHDHGDDKHGDPKVNERADDNDLEGCFPLDGEESLPLLNYG